MRKIFFFAAALFAASAFVSCDDDDDDKKDDVVVNPDDNNKTDDSNDDDADEQFKTSEYKADGVITKAGMFTNTGKLKVQYYDDGKKQWAKIEIDTEDGENVVMSEIKLKGVPCVNGNGVIAFTGENLVIETNDFGKGVAKIDGQIANDIVYLYIEAKIDGVKDVLESLPVPVAVDTVAITFSTKVVAPVEDDDKKEDDKRDPEFGVSGEYKGTYNINGKDTDVTINVTDFGNDTMNVDLGTCKFHDMMPEMDIDFDVAFKKNDDGTYTIPQQKVTIMGMLEADVQGTVNKDGLIEVSVSAKNQTINYSGYKSGIKPE